MIRFQCPTCHSILECPASKAGAKVACPKCQQRLQIPMPPGQPQRNRTILGQSVAVVRRPVATKAAPLPAPQTKPLDRRSSWFRRRLIGAAVLTGMLLVLCGGAWYVVRPVPHDEAVADREKDALKDITGHAFWKKKLAAKEVTDLADRIAKLQSGCLVIVNSEFRVWVLDPKDGDKASEDIFYWRQAHSREGLGMEFPLLGEVGESYFDIETKRWSTRPSREEVLGVILSGIKRADFHK